MGFATGAHGWAWATMGHHGRPRVRHWLLKQPSQQTPRLANTATAPALQLLSYLPLVFNPKMAPRTSSKALALVLVAVVVAALVGPSSAGWYWVAASCRLGAAQRPAAGPEVWWCSRPVSLGMFSSRAPARVLWLARAPPSALHSRRQGLSASPQGFRHSPRSRALPRAATPCQVHRPLSGITSHNAGPPTPCCALGRQPQCITSDASTPRLTTHSPPAPPPLLLLLPGILAYAACQSACAAACTGCGPAFPLCYAPCQSSCALVGAVTAVCPVPLVCYP